MTRFNAGLLYVAVASVLLFIYCVLTLKLAEVGCDCPRHCPCAKP